MIQNQQMPRYETPPGDLRKRNNPRVDKLKDDKFDESGYFQSDVEKEQHILVASNPKEELVTLGNPNHFLTKDQFDHSY